MFLVLRLRSIKFDPFRKSGGEEAGEDKVIALPAHGAKGDIEGEGKAAEPGGTPPEQGLTQIKLTDRSFESESFVKGAKAAFEMVVDAFDKGDTKSLRPLLSNDVYEDFSGAIKSRADNNETLESTLVGMLTGRAGPPLRTSELSQEATWQTLTRSSLIDPCSADCTTFMNWLHDMPIVFLRPTGVNND